MVVCYLLQSQNDYTEFKYSLRSVDKYFIPPYEVYVVGDHVPGWLTNVTVLIIPDIQGRKQLTIKKKTYTALEIVDRVFLMHDDCYLLDHTNGEDYPYYYQGSLVHNGESGARPLMQQLIQLKKQVKNFDIHQPLIFDRRFKDVFANFHSDVVVKSGYCNYLGIDGEPYIDLKVNRAMKQDDLERALIGRRYFSTGASGLGTAVPVLQKLFPEKSQFEI